MVKIVFVEQSGTTHSITAEVGQSLMEIAVNAYVGGVVAECGGGCACATCHVYIAADWIDRIDPASAMEIDMLECAVEIRPTSRLSCQVMVTQAHDGLIVEVPASQY
ncbi:2Fe-2S iron-sulfur cluster-binding protein [soil metagenome]